MAFNCSRRIYSRWDLPILAWASLVIAVLAWQTYAYSGVIAFLAEWQFRNFDRFFPIATIALLTALLVLPFVIVLMIRLRRMAKDAPPSRHEIIRRQTVGRRFTQVLSIGSFAAALIVVVIGVSAPGLNEKPAMLSAANPPQQDFSGFRLGEIAQHDRIFQIDGG